ncbi:hypothetical protein [uncultured Brevundimonas sp.]|uniref:hypothetical protein n=1 Tax=uncultured Brevundimonas sp. TaxID=213418 RepID=UPI0025DA1FC2|nr:hypothetical protein [uncultured Brevundimonas sp.]
MTLAERLVRLSLAWLPPRLRDWGEAMAREAGSIPSDARALLFAASCIAFAARVGISAAVRATSASGVNSTDTSRATLQDMPGGRGVTLACALIATASGLVYLATAGAPSRMLSLNALAFAAGLIIVLPLSARKPADGRFFGLVAIAAGGVLLITAGFGQQASGAARWISVGQVVLQPGLILVPLLALSFARSQDGLTVFGVALASLALALQPGRAMAGALLAGVAAVTIFTRNALTLLCVLMASLSLFATCVAPDVVPATPFVDRVFRTAFANGILPGVAVWAGAAVLLLPAVLGIIFDREHRPAHAVFGATWSAITLAAMLADYPAPLVSYGGSAIVGYLVCTLAMPRRWRISRKAVTPAEAEMEETGSGLLRRVCEA